MVLSCNRMLTAMAATVLLGLGTVAGRATETDTRKDVFEGDSRLEKAVRCELRHEPVSDLLIRLQADTGVQLGVEGDAADYRVTAFLEDVPLRQVLARLSPLLHVSWRRKGDGSSATYSVYVSEADRAAVARERAQHRAMLAQRVRAVLAAAAAPTGADPGLSRSIQAIISNPTIGPAARLLAASPPAVIEALLQGREIQLPYAQMSPPQRQAFLAYRQLRSDDAALGLAKSAELAARNGMPAPPAPAEPPPPEQQSLAASLGEDGIVSVGLVAPGSSGGSMFKFGLGAMVAEGTDVSAYRFGSAEQRLPSGTTIELPGGPLASWETVLARIARTSHLSILADAFDPSQVRPMDERFAAKLRDLPADQALDRVAAFYLCRWNGETSPVLFQYRDYARRREGQIPESAARRWREAARQRGVYSLDDLAYMSTLNAEQSLLLRQYAGMDAWLSTQGMSKDWLQFYAGLDRDQRRDAHAGGLGIDRLSLAQQRQIDELLSRAHPGARGLSDSFARFTVLEPERDLAAQITITLRNGSSVTHRVNRVARPMPNPWSPREIEAH